MVHSSYLDSRDFLCRKTNLNGRCPRPALVSQAWRPREGAIAQFHHGFGGVRSVKQLATVNLVSIPRLRSQFERRVVRNCLDKMRPHLVVVREGFLMRSLPRALPLTFALAATLLACGKSGAPGFTFVVDDSAVVDSDGSAVLLIPNGNHSGLSLPNPAPPPPPADDITPPLAPYWQFGDCKTCAGPDEGVYLKHTTTQFSYQQVGLGGTPGRVVIPEPVWKGATVSAGAKDAITARVSKRSGATISGPVTENWRIAVGSLKGFIYYSTYKSPLLPNDPATNTGGGILRVRPGSNAEVVRKGCVVCHSVSANGSVLSAAIGPDLSNPTSSDAVNLTVASPTPTMRSPASPVQQFAFSALTPDGTLALTNGNPVLVPPDLPHGFNGMYPSSLVHTAPRPAVNSPSPTPLP